MTSSFRVVDRVAIGIRYMAIGAFWFSVMSLLVKLAGRRLPSMEIVFFRGLVTLVLSYVTLARARITPIWGMERNLLVLRGVLGAAALACFLFSLTHLPLGEATLIHYTNPVFAILVAAIWFRERIGRGEVVALVASLFGVLLVTRPAWLFGGAASPFPAWWSAIALLGAAFSGAAYATIRRMPRERPEVVVFYLPLMSVPMGLLFAGSGWVMPTGWEWLLIGAIGLATQLAQTSMTRGLQIERTARATTTGYLQIVFAVMWGVLIFQEPVTMWTLAGAAVVVVGTLLLVTSRDAVVGVEE